MVSHEPSTQCELVILPHRGVADLDVTLILQPLSSVSGQDLQPTVEGLKNISSSLLVSGVCPNQDTGFLGSNMASYSKKFKFQMFLSHLSFPSPYYLIEKPGQIHIF